MTSSLFLAAAVTLLGPARSQQDIEAAAPGRHPRLPTRLATEYIEPAEAVVLARTQSISALGTAVAVVRLRVLERIHARPGVILRPGREIVVMTYPGQLDAGTEELLYLKRFGQGDRFELLFRIEGRSKDFASRLAVTRRTAELLRMEQEPERLQALREWLVSTIEFGDAWSAEYAADELVYMAANHRWALTPATATRLRQAAARCLHKGASARVMIVADQIQEHFEGLPNPEEKGPSRP